MYTHTRVNYMYMYMYLPIAIFMHSACVHMYMHMYALCSYTRHLRTCLYAAMHVNRPSGISHAAAIAVNCTQGVKLVCLGKNFGDFEAIL